MNFTARIWPWLHHVCHIRSRAVGDRGKGGGLSGDTDLAGGGEPVLESMSVGFREQQGCAIRQHLEKQSPYFEYKKQFTEKHAKFREK